MHNDNKQILQFIDIRIQIANKKKTGYNRAHWFQLVWSFCFVLNTLDDVVKFTSEENKKSKKYSTALVYLSSDTILIKPLNKLASCKFQLRLEVC